MDYSQLTTDQLLDLIANGDKSKECNAALVKVGMAEARAKAKQLKNGCYMGVRVTTK
jgi:hypothetical protein